jgi:hypothetical protein
MLMADDARRWLQDLPIRLPMRLKVHLTKVAREDVKLGKDSTLWLHEIHGDPITGRDKREARLEIYTDDFDNNPEEQEPDYTVVIDEPVSHMMPRDYLAGLSQVEFNVTTKIHKRAFVALRWEIHAMHSQPLFGVPATNKDVNLSGMTLLRFEQETNPDGSRVYTAKDEWTYWDLPALLEQIGATP